MLSLKRYKVPLNTFAMYECKKKKTISDDANNIYLQIMTKSF